MKVFGPNGRHEATLAGNFNIESSVLVASRPPACSNGGTQDCLPNFSANSQFHFFSPTLVVIFNGILKNYIFLTAKCRVIRVGLPTGGNIV